MVKYKRILLKLSGESLMGNQQYGIDENRLFEYASQIKEITELGVQVGIVFGGGNIFRGLSGAQKGFDRVKGDQMGMLATVINSLALNSALQTLGVKSKVFTAIRMEPVAIFYSRDKAVESLEKNEVAIFSGGTGNPYFTTDTASALRAVEIGADVMIKGTRVDGVYTADPEKDPAATKIDNLTFEEMYNQNLKIMDLTATTLCMENKMPVVVFNMDKKGNLLRLINGGKIGSVVSVDPLF
jgi:uridylate kinase